jgi:hypothetical protein
VKRALNALPQKVISSLMLGARGPGHVEPVARLDLQSNHLHAYLEGTQVDHRAHAVTNEANPAGIGRTALKGYVDIGRDATGESQSVDQRRRGRDEELARSSDRARNIHMDF